MLHPSHVHLSTTNVTQGSNRRFLPDSKLLQLVDAILPVVRTEGYYIFEREGTTD